MIARYDGICVKCGVKIQEGISDIGWSRKPRPNGLNKAAWHLTCAMLADNDTVVAELLVKQSKHPYTMPESILETKPKEIKPMQSAQGDFLTGLAEALVPHLEGRIGANIDGIKEQVTETLNGLESKLQELIDKSVKTIVFENKHTGEFKNIGKQHIKFEEITKLIALGKRNLYLYGDPGSGKSTAAEKMAEALNLAYGYTSLTIQTSESRLVGFANANGDFVETEFYKFYTQGGVFCIDEIDNASGNLLTALNSALATGNGTFPVMGTVKRHPDFICIATGNTTGFGHNPLYPERQPLSGAIRDRFLFINWGYDESFERELALAQHDNKSRTGDWVKWVQKVRKYAKQYDAKLPVTPRASIEGARLLDTFTPSEVAHMVIFRGYDNNSVTRIISNNPLPVVA